MIAISILVNLNSLFCVKSIYYFFSLLDFETSTILA